jgi:hypothetical protein
VHAERTWSQINYNYQRDACLDKGGEVREYENVKDRCYYPDDYYESTARSLINTKITEEEHPVGFMILKKVPHFAYGTRGAYAGILRENSVFEESIDDEKNIPIDYWTDWTPRDTRNYKLQWRITNLKEINLEDGNYTMCNYYFGDVLIDINDCDKLDRVEIDNSRNRMDVWFNAERGYQNLSVKVYDPIMITYTEKDIVKKSSIIDKGTSVCFVREIENPTTTTLYKDGTKIVDKETIQDCYKREYLLDPFYAESRVDIFGLKSVDKQTYYTNTTRIYTDDESLIVR